MGVGVDLELGPSNGGDGLIDEATSGITHGSGNGMTVINGTLRRYGTQAVKRIETRFYLGLRLVNDSPLQCACNSVPSTLGIGRNCPIAPELGYAVHYGTAPRYSCNPD